MSNTQRLAEQVYGILSRNEVGFTANDEGTEFHIPYESTAGFINVADYGDGTVVSFRAVVLENLNVSGTREAAILKRLNQLNREGMFGTFWLDEQRGAILLEHQLLGDELESAELMNALGAVIDRADALDDELKKEFSSGETWSDADERMQGEASEPTIST